MAAKKHTSKAQSAAREQLDKQAKPTINELALGLSRQFLADTKQLTGEVHCDDRIRLAFQYFTGWPNEFWLLDRQAKKTAADLHAFRALLAQAHEAATAVLMREATTRGLASGAIWTESRFAREEILSRKKFHLGKYGWQRPWPDCLSSEMQSLPEWQQQAIVKGEAVLMELATLLDGKTEPYSSGRTWDEWKLGFKRAGCNVSKTTFYRKINGDNPTVRSIKIEGTQRHRLHNGDMEKAGWLYVDP